MLKLSLLLDVLFVVRVGPVPEPEAPPDPVSILLPASEASVLDRERDVDPSLPRPPEVPGRAEAVVLEGEGVSLLMTEPCWVMKGEPNIC